jgi:hypothetical protein
VPDPAADALAISLTEERYDRYDPAHGTPDPMVRRLLIIHIGTRTARFEQTDYGHPGRFNPWEPRGIDATLQPRTAELRALCDAIGALLT